MELVTGRLSLDEFEAEVTAIADFLVAVGVPAVLVTFGAGCDYDQIDPLEPVLVAPALLASFVDEQDERGAYRLAASDLFLKADSGGLAFLLCEEADIHCYADDPASVADIRERWATLYPDAHEADRESRSWRSLRGGPWRPFVGASEPAEPGAAPDTAR
ncbi:hypothetical protein R5W23_001545 [Gemmata sp. JC673]|uniref:DUF4262 domain-containing protein n=1 Tax=Gemmata algarum TaxID=2975278 RepID=A0ABU5EYC4_9BACT|nr:hypothetical protein [Gemmata algarum]MDY3560313.1 hypothetical protein [Gemmata algarum]